VLPNQFWFVGAPEGHLDTVWKPGSRPNVHIAHLGNTLVVDQFHGVDVFGASDHLS